MKKKITHRWSFILGVFLVTFVLAEGTVFADKQDARIATAQECFKTWVDLGNSFNPKVGGMYAEDALIQNTRHYPNGQSKKLVLPASSYRAMLASVMPLAQQRGDTNTYSDLSYVRDKGKVRIRGTRYSALKKYKSPIVLLMGVESEDRCKIFEEITESQP